jgi:CRP/FNR family cyclic AMP-dependent transcriptional regulator
VPVTQIRRARGRLTAPLRTLAPGMHDVPADEGARGYLGFLIVNGLVARDLLLAGQTSTELLGGGDFLQPWLGPRDDRLVQHKVFWHILTPVELAVLDDGFARALQEWPQVTAALLERALRRANRMAVHQALLGLTPVETRLLVLFWHLAERWGRVTPDGICVRLTLTHQLLGQLVGCQRASATTALKHLVEDRDIRRRADGTWLLVGDPPDELSRITWPPPAPHVVSADHGLPRRAPLASGHRLARRRPADVK